MPKLSPRMLQYAAERAKKETTQEKRRIIHLGNVRDRGITQGEPRTAAKTRRYAKRFRKFQFVGIDIAPMPGRRPKNLEQRRKNFSEGLEKEIDNSVDLISSEMALGYYKAYPKSMIDTKSSRKRRKHTKETIKLAFIKLKPGGKMHITVGNPVLREILKTLKKTGFEVEHRKSTHKEWLRTFFTAKTKKRYEITATKPI